MYMQAIRQVFKQDSIFVQQSSGSGFGGSGAGSLIRSPLLNGSLAFREKTLLEDKQIALSLVNPMQMLDLSSWTDYMKPQGNYFSNGSGDDVMVLIEAMRPQDINKFRECQLEIPMAEKVHILSKGEAVAWHCGSPFGILMHCRLEEFIALAIALGDHVLALDEDLEVKSMMTVQVKGKSATLFDIPDSQVNLSTHGPNVSSSNLMARSQGKLLTEEKDLSSDMWSNESLASDTSNEQMDLLEMSEDVAFGTEGLEGAINESGSGTENLDDVVNESGSGEGLSEVELEMDSNTNSVLLSQSWRVVQSPGSCKPPNILVYTGKQESVGKFENMKAILEQCLDTDCYVIYQLRHDNINTTPWIDNTCLLVLACKDLYTSVNRTFVKYFNSGGKIIAFGSGLDTEFIGRKIMRTKSYITELTFQNWTGVSLISSGYVYNTNELHVTDCTVTNLGTDKDGNIVIVKLAQASKGSSPGCAIFSQVLFLHEAVDFEGTSELFNLLKKSNTARFEILRQLLTSLGLDCNTRSPNKLTAAVLVAKSEDLKLNFLRSVQNQLSSSDVLKFGMHRLLFAADTSAHVEDNQLLVITENVERVSTHFNVDEYFGNLKTKVLGNTVIYSDVVQTTMTLLDGLMFHVPHNVGLIAIARQQTSGHGRGGNSWLSPVGCAMFTLHVKMPLDSMLGRAVSYLQHITSLAVVYSVCTLTGYQDIDLRLKWPNDIYYGNQMKLGGVIVKSTIIDGTIHAVLGCGFNVSNSNPTICINDLVQLHNRQTGCQLAPCTTEQLIGRCVTYIESLVDMFQKEGLESFRQKYYEKWLHSDCEVTLQSEGNIKVTIKGLDDYGYLLVKTPAGDKISVQPDGNSFDMMKNLIFLKTRQ